MPTVTKTVTKDNWILQAASVNYGNGSTKRITVGSTSVSGSTGKCRYLGKVLAADVSALLSGLATASSVVARFTVADNTCATRGGTYYFFLEELTGDFDVKTGLTDCQVYTTTSYPNRVWPGPSVKTAKMATAHPTGLSDGSTFDIDITAWANARIAAGDFSAFYFRLVAAKSDFSAYDESNSARTLTLRSSGYSGSAPSIIATGTTSGGSGASVSATPIAATGRGVANNPQQGGLDVDGEFGEITLANPSTDRWLHLGSVSQIGILVASTFTIDALPVGGYLHERLLARYTDKNNHYEADAVIAPDGTVSLSINLLASGVLTQLATISDVGTVFEPGQLYYFNFQTSGATPTSLYAKLWRKDVPAPDWQVTAVDSTAARQLAGSAGVSSGVGTITNHTITFQHDDFTAVAA